MDWIWKKYWKKSLRYPWPWKSTVKVTFHFLHKRKLEMAFQLHGYAKNGKNSKRGGKETGTRGLTKIKHPNGITFSPRPRRWSWVMSAKFVLLFFTYSAHQTTYENLLKTWLILETKRLSSCLWHFFRNTEIFTHWKLSLSCTLQFLHRGYSVRHVSHTYFYVKFCPLSIPVTKNRPFHLKKPSRPSNDLQIIWLW